MQLRIIDFIHNNPDWESKLTEPPYFVKTKREDDFVLLKYEQFQSDFNLQLVRECRGIILDESDGYRPVCVPFTKFGNIGESYVPEIDWTTAYVQEKVDGSLIKLWHYKSDWHISSNGEIDARNAHIHSALLKKARRTDLYSIFVEAWDKTGIHMESLDKDFTYMFELISPYNRVVVRYGETAVRHIGTRNNLTFLECEIDIGIPKPHMLPFRTLDECIENAKRLGDNEEGYVIVDRYFNRIKVKSPRYVALNHLSQGMTTYGNIVEIIQKSEQDEFLTYFPEYRDVFNDILHHIDAFTSRQTVALAEIQSAEFDSRKSLADVVMKTECPACLFVLIDGKEASPRDWLMSRPANKILQYIGLENTNNGVDQQ